MLPSRGSLVQPMLAGRCRVVLSITKAHLSEYVCQVALLWWFVQSLINETMRASHTEDSVSRLIPSGPANSSL
jgi:hypothetical protein